MFSQKGCSSVKRCSMIAKPPIERMSTMSNPIGAAALGQRVAQLREAAGMKQADLARQVTWSQAVLSRIEAGEREVTSEELDELLARIGTPEASALAEIVSRRWRQLPSPPLDHSDHQLLWAAEEVACALAAQAQAEEIRPAFLRRLEEYLAELKQAVGLLLRREHSIAFIGAIGIGKSTAICRATGLEVLVGDGPPSPVLETGAGGITLCEVSLKLGPGYGVIVTPRSTEEVREDVADFADLLLTRAEVGTASDAVEDGQRAVPRELERAIRNLSGLRPNRTKGPDGKFIRKDPAKDLAVEIGSTRELTVEILSRMELPKRDRRESWHDVSSNMSPLDWLKQMFEQINNGRHPDFSLPAHVDLIVPALLETGDLTVSVIDTRGIDRVTARADLEEHLMDTHTVSVLCSGFNDAPAQPVQHLLERARDIRNTLVNTHASILVLARPGEALAVKDEIGERAESDEEGYALKGEQIASALTPVGMQDLPVEFFNSFMDDPERLKAFITGRVEATRETFRRNLQAVVDSARELLANLEREQVLEVQRDASRHIATWLKNHVDPPNVGDHVYDTLMAQIRSAHVSTINASIRREGEWYLLSYTHQLGFGARRIAVASLRDWLMEFRGIATNLLETHPEAAELLGQATRLMDQAYDELLKKMQVAGASLYREELQRAQVLWMELSREWGTGLGYRDRVAQRQGKWFEEGDQDQVEAEILGILRREWVSVLGRVAAIFDSE